MLPPAFGRVALKLSIYRFRNGVSCQSKCNLCKTNRDNQAFSLTKEGNKVKIEAVSRQNRHVSDKKSTANRGTQKPDFSVRVKAPPDYWAQKRAFVYLLTIITDKDDFKNRTIKIC